MSHLSLTDRAYADLSGRDLSGIDYYAAFGFWKLACIAEGVLARYRSGAMGDVDHDHRHFSSDVERWAEAAADLLG